MRGVCRTAQTLLPGGSTNYTEGENGYDLSYFRNETGEMAAVDGAWRLNASSANPPVSDLLRRRQNLEMTAIYHTLF